MRVDDQELILITGGGISLSGTLLNSISKLITTLLDLGRSIGSAIRYGRKKISC